VNAVLDWRNLVFYIPLGLGAMLAVGAGLGFGDGDGHGHCDPDHLGGGPLPLTLRLMLGTLLFGGLGLLLGPTLRAVTPGPPALGGWLAVLVTLTGAVVTSRVIGRMLGRRVRLFESETIRRTDLLGASGRLVVGGTVQVRDARGDLYQFRCRPAPGEAGLRPGAEVVLLDYDEAAQTFVVAAL
jgi:hypothetical protein